MATPLRYALIFLLWAMVAVIYAPLIPAALTLISPALSLTHWQALFADPQLPQALLATLVSTTIAAVGALLIALLVIVALWPGPKWQRMCARLPWLLAIPHVAFATSALLLFADGGLLYDYFPYFTPPMDRFGIGLGLTLAVKESAFLLWILAAVLSEKWLLQQVIVLDSLGYSRWQCLNWLLLPSVAPALAMAKLLAVADWRQSPLFSDEERLALEYAEAASVTPPTVDDALRTRLAAHFDAQALTELTALIGLQNLSARFNSAMDIPAQGLCRIPEKRS